MSWLVYAGLSAFFAGLVAIFVRERLNVIAMLRRRLDEVCAGGQEGMDGPLA